MSQIHFSLAGSFLFYLLLSSTDEDEIDYWTATIREYRQLLELDHYGFPVTRLAATRMALLATVNGDGDVSMQAATSKTAMHAQELLLGSDGSEGEYFDGDLKVELGG